MRGERRPCPRDTSCTASPGTRPSWSATTCWSAPRRGGSPAAQPRWTATAWMRSRPTASTSTAGSQATAALGCTPTWPCRASGSACPPTGRQDHRSASAWPRPRWHGTSSPPAPASSSTSRAGTGWSPRWAPIRWPPTRTTSGRGRRSHGTGDRWASPCSTSRSSPASATCCGPRPCSGPASTRLARPQRSTGAASAGSGPRW